MFKHNIEAEVLLIENGCFEQAKQPLKLQIPNEQENEQINKMNTNDVTTHDIIDCTIY